MQDISTTFLVLFLFDIRDPHCYYPLWLANYCQLQFHWMSLRIVVSLTLVAFSHHRLFFAKL